jgi:hypothetical protein
MVLAALVTPAGLAAPPPAVAAGPPSPPAVAPRAPAIEWYRSIAVGPESCSDLRIS